MYIDLTQIAFPGGKREKNETDLEACKREVLEEVGWDLDGTEFELLGRLDDREVKAPASARRVMVLCCFVFLQKEDVAIKTDPNEISLVYWVPVNEILECRRWEAVSFPITQHLFQGTNSILNALVGSYSFYGVPINENRRAEHIIEGTPRPSTAHRLFPLWGLTLWMTSDFLEQLGHPCIGILGKPRYSSPEVDLFISLMYTKKDLQTSLVRDRMRFGLGYITVVRVAVALSLTLKAAGVYAVFKLVGKLRK
ncbi:hypothetical protein HK103_001286 [Boothiomyces macroporosus]|uniref:Nudix hydrolase domain-containing protein n=1 Tax=Boothiomyces macroporosus TaxID=261099 RepID=A0AAD5UBI5_9FUNG|nr:hypothetical protein HK103_001286 [Boothiomyces macroporosus]